MNAVRSIVLLTFILPTSSALADVKEGDYFVGDLRSAEDTSMYFEQGNRIKYCTYDGCGNFKYQTDRDGTIRFRAATNIALRENADGNLIADFTTNSGGALQREFQRRPDPYTSMPVYPISYESFTGDWGGKKTAVKILNKTRLEYCYAGDCKQYKYKRSGNRYRIDLGKKYWIEFHRLEKAYELTYFDAAQDKFYYITLRQ